MSDSPTKLWLRENTLVKIYPALSDQDYSGLTFLREMTAAEDEEFVNAVTDKSGTKSKLRKALRVLFPLQTRRVNTLGGFDARERWVSEIEETVRGRRKIMRIQGK